MNEHETVRNLMGLAAAGVLGPEEQSRVERHVRECNACRKEMDVWRVYASGLEHMPQPAVPACLAERTQIRVLREQEARTQRRHNILVLVGLSVLGWSWSLAVWLVLRLVMGGATVVMQTHVLRLDVWALTGTLLVWASAAIGAVLLAKRRREWRTVL